MKEFSKLSLSKNVDRKIKRPIDAIKHQAKTVTVGATRSINLSDAINNEEINTDLVSNTKFKFKNKFKKQMKIFTLLEIQILIYLNILQEI